MHFVDDDDALLLLRHMDSMLQFHSVFRRRRLTVAMCSSWKMLASHRGPETKTGDDEEHGIID